MVTSGDEPSPQLKVTEDPLIMTPGDKRITRIDTGGTGVTKVGLKSANSPQQN